MRANPYWQQLQAERDDHHHGEIKHRADSLVLVANAPSCWQQLRAERDDLTDLFQSGGFEMQKTQLPHVGGPSREPVTVKNPRPSSK